MNIIQYLKKNGIQHAIKVIYQYKIDNVILKVMKLLYRNAPLKNVIMIESHNDFDCNGGAFYDYLIKNGYDKTYKIVWVLKNRKPELPENVIAVPLLKPSILKDYYISRAKFFTSDCFTVCRKINKNQKAIFFDHGQIGLKDLTGMMTVSDCVDYIATASETWKHIIAREYQMLDRLDRFRVIGYPYDDVILSPSSNEIAKVTAKKFHKVILWMPTFRKGGGYQRNDSSVEQPLGIPLFDSIDQFEEFNRWLAEKEMLVILKIHPMQDLSTLKACSCSNICVLTGQTVKERNIDNYRLMKDVDACISDYSSAIYDFLLLERPMAYDLSDLQYYTPGLCVDPVEDYIAGPKLMCYDDLIKFLMDLAENKDYYAEARHALKQKLYQYTDTCCCERAAELLGL